MAVLPDYQRWGIGSRYGIHCQWPGVPDPAFMILVLDETTLRGISGVVRYRDEFDRGM
jgi:predicted N-acetyltransferase YhbS